MIKPFVLFFLFALLMMTDLGYGNMRFPSPVTDVTFTSNGSNIDEPFDLEVECFESRDGRAWGAPYRGSCTANPCANHVTSEMMLMQSNLANNYLSKCRLSVIRADARRHTIDALDLKSVLRCEKSGVSSSVMKCLATIDLPAPR